MRMATPRVQEKRRSSTRRSPSGSSGAVADVEVVAALDARSAGAAAADQEADEIAGVIEPALGDRDQRAGERPAARHHRQTFDAPCCTAAS